MKKIHYHSLIAFLSLLIVISCSDGPNSSDTKPETADEVAHAIEKAIHKQDWDQTKWVHWIFPGPREHLWDQERGFAEIKWNNYRAVINLNSKEGRVYENDQLIDGTKKDSLMQKNWSA